VGAANGAQMEPGPASLFLGQCVVDPARHCRARLWWRGCRLIMPGTWPMRVSGPALAWVVARKTCWARLGAYDLSPGGSDRYSDSLQLGSFCDQ